jgi:hypothetical protein
VNGEGGNGERKDVHGIEVLYDDLSQFQVAKVDRAVAARPY